jgi:prevent-host-death family protein
MRHVNSTDFKNHFGEFLDLARNEPIAVNILGKPVAVLVSAEEFAFLQRLDDLNWIARATAAEAAGEWVSHEEAMALLLCRLSPAR